MPTTPASTINSNVSNQKMKSWSNTIDNNLNSARSPRNPEPINIRERTSTPELRNGNNALTNWQSTISGSEKHLIVSDACKDLNTNFSSHYEEELFSPRCQSHRAGSENRIKSPILQDNSEQEIEIQLSTGENNQF